MPASSYSYWQNCIDNLVVTHVPRTYRILVKSSIMFTFIFLLFFWHFCWSFLVAYHWLMSLCISLNKLIISDVGGSSLIDARSVGSFTHHLDWGAITGGYKVIISIEDHCKIIIVLLLLNTSVPPHPPPPSFTTKKERVHCIKGRESFIFYQMFCRSQTLFSHCCDRCGSWVSVR